MAYKLQPGRMYMMPTHFGPAAGPRQGPDGRRFDGVESPRTTSYSVSFLTRPEQLEVLLPVGFRLYGDPVVTVTVSYMTEIEWLAGRGYNTVGVSFPAEYRGKRDRALGPFLAVLWENLTDPILTGREQLGFSKIYCAIPPPDVLNDETRCTADWLGFRFMEMNLSELETQPVTEAEAPVAETEDADLTGTLHYKYVPRTGEWSEADAEYAVMTPFTTPNRRVTAQRTGRGSVRFHRAEWRDLPTQYHIVNAFADLEQIDFLSARIVETVGGKDLSDQRILR